MWKQVINAIGYAAGWVWVPEGQEDPGSRTDWQYFPNLDISNVSFANYQYAGLQVGFSIDFAQFGISSLREVDKSYIFKFLFQTSLINDPTPFNVEFYKGEPFLTMNSDYSQLVSSSNIAKNKTNFQTNPLVEPIPNGTNSGPPPSQYAAALRDDTTIAFFVNWNNDNFTLNSSNPPSMTGKAVLLLP